MKIIHKIGAFTILLFFVIISTSQSFITKRESNMETLFNLDSLPVRQGTRPSTTDTNPHTQLNQQPRDLSYIKKLMDWAFT